MKNLSKIYQFLEWKKVGKEPFDTFLLDVFSIEGTQMPCVVNFVSTETSIRKPCYPNVKSAHSAYFALGSYES